MFSESKREIIVKSLEVVDARTTVDFLSVGGDEWWFDFLAALDLSKVFVDNSGIETRHSKL